MRVLLLLCFAAPVLAQPVTEYAGRIRQPVEPPAGTSVKVSEYTLQDGSKIGVKEWTEVAHGPDRLTRKSPGCLTDLKEATAKANREGKPLVVWCNMDCTEHPQLRAALDRAVNVHVSLVSGDPTPRVGVGMGGEYYSIPADKITEDSAPRILAPWEREYARLNAAQAPAPPITYMGAPVGSGCTGFTAGYSSGFAAAPVAAGGCVGFTAGYSAAPVYAGSGCVGGTAGYSGAYPPVTYSAPVSYGAPVYGAPVVYGAPTYGARFADGTYATPTGRPPGPGLLGTPGAPWGVSNGPIREGLRMLFGRDPGAPVSGFGSGGT